MIAATKPALKFIDLACPRCGYSLAGLPGPALRCPECGEVYDPNLIRRQQRIRGLVSIATMLVVLYAPYIWLLFEHADAAYTRYWIWRWPILPGLPLAMLFSALTGGRGGGHRDVLMVVITSLFLGGFIYFSMHGAWRSTRHGAWRKMIFWTLIAFVLSCINSYFARVIFLA